jgi:hypothetical protein
MVKEAARAFQSGVIAAQASAKNLDSANTR